MSQGSTKPPGATSFTSTAFGIIPRDELLKLEVEGTKRGLEYIYGTIKSHQQVAITPDLILKLHAVSFQWIFPEWAGKFRTIQVTYSGKEAPFYSKIPELVKILCDDLKVQLKHLPNSSDLYFIDEVIKLLAWFQHQFVFIHPFQDYNGRLARMLTVLLMLKMNLPASEIKVETVDDRKKYLDAMQEGDQGNLSLLEKLITASLTRQLEI